MNTLWIITELFPPEETSTGYIMGELANVFSQKYIVKVICGADKYDKHKAIELKNNSNACRYEVIRVRNIPVNKNKKIGKALSFLWMSCALYKQSKKFIKKNDKVLIVTNPAPLILLISHLKRKIGFELNILVHDIFPENTKCAGIALPAYNIIKNIFDKAYSNADNLIAIGRDMKFILEEKVKKYKNDYSINIIENWAETKTIEYKPISAGPIKLQYAGNIGRVQGIDKVIDQLPDGVEFHIYGTGAMENILKSKKHPRVYFHGPYLRSQQNDILSKCTIALVTLENGMYGLGVPSKTYNILASGRPILYFGPKGSEIDLLIKENHVGYCNWPERWDIKEFETMGQQSRILAETKYSKEIILKKFLEII